MQVQGTVISISLETQVKKNGGGSYAGWELVYKTPEGEVRTIAKPVTGLKFNAPLKADLQALAGGDQFTLEQEKNQAGFFDVKSIKKGWGVVGTPTLPASAPAQALPTSNNKPANNYQASSYPTKEERLVTQNQIVRQSSLAQAVATLAAGSKTALNPEDVIKVAEQYVNWVKSVPEGMDAIAEMKDDIPY